MKRVFTSRAPFEERPLTEQVKALRSLITDDTGEIRPLIVKMARAAARDFFEEIREGFRLSMEQDPDFVAWQQGKHEAQMAAQMEAKRSVLTRHMVLGYLSAMGMASDAELRQELAGVPADDVEAALRALADEGWITRSGSTYIRSGNYDAYDKGDEDEDSDSQ